MSTPVALRPAPGSPEELRRILRRIARRGATIEAREIAAAGLRGLESLGRKGVAVGAQD